MCFSIPPVSQVAKGVPMTYRLQLKQGLAVQDLKPAVVEVYDYYKPSRCSMVYAFWLNSWLNMPVKLTCCFHFQVTHLRPHTCLPVCDLCLISGYRMYEIKLLF